MIRGYRFSLPRLTIDLGPVKAVLPNSLKSGLSSGLAVDVNRVCHLLGESDDDRTHEVAFLKVFFRTGRMGIVTGDARVGDG